MFKYMDIFAWMLVIGALIGAVFNSCGRYLLSFKIWMLTNLLFFIYNLAKKDYAQAFLFFAYFLISVNGWHNLHKSHTVKSNHSRTQKNEKLANKKTKAQKTR